MTPKEKARQLVNSFIIEIDYDSVSNVAWRNPMDEKEQIRTMKDAKRYALIVVNEIIKALRKDLPEIGLGKGYWSSVKKEIKKL